MKKPDIGYSIYFSIIKSRRTAKDFVKFCHTRAGNGQTIVIQFHNVKIEPDKDSEGWCLKTKDLDTIVNGLSPIADNIIFCDRYCFRTNKETELSDYHKKAIKSVLKTEIKEAKKMEMRKLIDEIIAEQAGENEDGEPIYVASNDDYEVTVVDRSFNLDGETKVFVKLEVSNV